MYSTPITHSLRILLFPHTSASASRPKVNPQLRKAMGARVRELLTSSRGYREANTRGTVSTGSLSGFYGYPGPLLRPRLHYQNHVGQPIVAKDIPDNPGELTKDEKKNFDENYERALQTAHAVRRRYGLRENSDPEIEEAAIKSLTRAVKNYDPNNEHGASFTTFLHAGLFPDVRKACFKALRRQGQDIEDIEALPANGPGVEDAVADRQLRKTLEREVKRLPPRTADIVRRHTGLGEGKKESLKTIAEDLHMHEVSVRRLFGQGLKTLREALSDQGVEEFISREFFIEFCGEGHGQA